MNKNSLELPDKKIQLHNQGQTLFLASRSETELDLSCSQF